MKSVSGESFFSQVWDHPLTFSDAWTGALAIVPESSLVLFQRDFLKGDVVKRSLTAVESAMVVDIKAEVQLHHALTLQKIRGWVPVNKLSSSIPIEVRDKVVYNNWIGEVVEVGLGSRSCGT